MKYTQSIHPEYTDMSDTSRSQGRTLDSVQDLFFLDSIYVHTVYRKVFNRYRQVPVPV